MKQLTLLFLLASMQLVLAAQGTNLELLGHLPYPESIELNDIWGYAAPDGTEYALVGTTKGLSIVSLADPTAPEEIEFIPGSTTTWRDIKVWEQYAYVSSESFDGLLIVDLSNLPDSVTYNHTLHGAHNIFIDEFGYLYLTSSSALIFDLKPDPKEPQLVGSNLGGTSHDIYARDNIVYSSNINDGILQITDLSDKANPILLANIPTPDAFTHHSWLSDDGQTLFTTDELSDSPLASYDISDLGNVKLLDVFRSGKTIGQGTIPHNVFVQGDFLVLSYYTDGVLILDSSDPSNLIEVGSYDTYPLEGNFGYNGCWGVYPYLPSGIIIASDMQFGLYVLQPEYVKACYLGGTISNASTGEAIHNVNVQIEGELATNEYSDLSGQYSTGTPNEGLKKVSFWKEGFHEKTVEIELLRGELVSLDTALEPVSLASISGQVIDQANNQAIPNAQIEISTPRTQYTTISDENGQFSFQGIEATTYTVYAQAWGYLLKESSIDVTQSIASIALEKGYQDDFIFDFDWISEGKTWSIASPTGAFSLSDDLPDDIGEKCAFLSAQTGVGPSKFISPMMDLTNYDAPTLSCHFWFGLNPLVQRNSLIVRINNGNQEIELEKIPSTDNAWQYFEFQLNDFDIELTEQMQFSVELERHIGVLVAGIDGFKVEDAIMSSGNEYLKAAATALSVAPNPFTSSIQLELLQSHYPEVQMEVFNSLGQQLYTQEVSLRQALSIGENWSAGIYFIRLVHEEKVLFTEKLIKQ